MYFYTITSLLGRPGFGITGNPGSRIKDYTAHWGEIATFPKLYKGYTPHIKSLESTIKKMYADDIWVIDEWRTEWLKDGLVFDDLMNTVNELLESRSFWKIELVDENFSVDL